MEKYAPGHPGMPPRWSSSAKDGVGTAVGADSPVWFTLSHGIVNEVFYPRVDRACTRDLGLIVTDGSGWFSEEKRHTRAETSCPEGVPAYEIVNTCIAGRYRVAKTVLSDPARPVVLQRVRFTALQGSGYHVFALLAPHLNNGGADNTAILDDYKGVPMLFAARDGHALALACSTGWIKRSAGFVGASDGWQDLSQHGAMEWEYERAENGNVALTGEIALQDGGEFVLALGFGDTRSAAGERALASLQDGFEKAHAAYVRDWQAWQKTLLPLDGGAGGELYHISAAVLRTHESVQFPGAIIASLSIPWGFNKGDDDLGGYHLVWPRDLVESAQALLALGSAYEARAVLGYLMATQNADGHWNQNQWLGGKPYWGGIQLDETAFPVLLAASLAERDALGGMQVADSVRRALAFLILHGPASPQDRWEEDAGVNPFTLAVCIAALVAGAALLPEAERALPLAVADFWNARLEDWCVARDTELGAHYGVAAYYLREAPSDILCDDRAMQRVLPINNRSYDLKLAADAQVATDFLQL
ncbi:MAG TPA: glycoside hydrolase family 15 protein, partial [Ramlibacter sp.]|nr:glycoside hydrolase family 15 protein [Ramlibacter sp.]